MNPGKSKCLKNTSLVLAGPTSAGKSETALRLAEQYNCPVISADARQCYKYLDIGTGKISSEQLQRIPHYNISIFPPDQPDTAADFARRCIDWEEEIARQSELLLYAGGSTLHLQSILYPLDHIPAANSENIRRLEERAKTEGIEVLYEELKNTDPDYVKKMDGMNRQRIIRALDVWMQTGQPFSSFHQQNVAKPQKDLLLILCPERQLLHERINNRVDKMINSGLIDEVKSILEMGYSPDLQSLQTVGYQEVIAYLSGNLGYSEMIEKIKTQTRRYAKRQITWFRRWKDAHWIDSGQSITDILTEIEPLIESALQNRNSNG